MALQKIFNDIAACDSAEELFDLACDYFRGQGFGAVIYVAPQAAAGPYTLMADGSARFIRNSVSLAAWRALGSRAGGEPIPPDAE